MTGKASFWDYLIGQLVDTNNQIETLEARYETISDRQQRLARQAEQFPEAIARSQQLEQQILSLNEEIKGVRA